MPARLIVVAVCAVLAPALVAPAHAAPSATFVKSYSNIVAGKHIDLTPEDVQATSDGGYVALGLTQSSATGVGVSWVLKLSATGAPQWQRAIGCAGTPPGDYADGLSIAQTADGGYVIGGGTIGCGSGTSCPPSSGLECALVERLSATGAVTWAKVYPAGASGSSIRKVQQTSDGGYIAVGTATDAHQHTGALLLKLDGQGNTQWQRRLGPGVSNQAELNAVQQTSDGGYAATGQFYRPTTETPRSGVLAVKLDQSGKLVWLHGFNSFKASTPTASELASSIIQSSDGGYAIAGHWSDSFAPGACCSGALVLKLDTNGKIQWQKAYSGGIYCFENGFSETCANIGGVAYSIHQASDGGYVLAGDGNLKLNDSVPLEPWLAKVDASGNLQWQHLYYQVNPATGRPLSEYFASSATTADGGIFGVGFTESLSDSIGNLFGVKTDGSGLAGPSCGDVHAASELNPVDPALTLVTPSLAVHANVSPSSNSPSTSVATSISTQTDC
jgi:hypothetical protein